MLLLKTIADLFRSKHVFKVGDQVRIHRLAMQAPASFFPDNPDLWDKESFEVMDVIPVPGACTCGKDLGDGKFHEDVHDPDCDIHQRIANRHPQKVVIKTTGKRLEYSGAWFERI